MLRNHGRYEAGSWKNLDDWHKPMRRAVWSIGLAVVVGLVATSAAAQVTYTVFPAVVEAPEERPQPTNRGVPAVKLVVQDSTVAYVIHALAHQADLRVSYDNADPTFGRRIDVNVVNVDVMNAFAVALQGTGLVARMAPDGETIVVRQRLPGRTMGGVLDGILVGRVTDSAGGQGLGGASVKIAGTKLTAVTSDSGNFTVRDVPPGDQVLIVRLFGYKPVERTVTVVDSQRTTVRITLVSVPTVLSGVVTTATGQQRRIEVGNDITSLNVDSIRQVAPITSVTDLLESRVPGLTVLHSSGTPGDPSRIRLRGASSVQLDNDPIIIVDGIRVYSQQSNQRNNNLANSEVVSAEGTPNAIVNNNSSGSLAGAAFTTPSPLDQIDPANIETIEVLKGPSATAIYGSDAANGVIIITTKHGRTGPTRWTSNLGAAVNWIPGSWPINYYRFGTDTTGATYVGGTINRGFSGYTGICQWYQSSSCTVDSIIPFQALNDPRYTVLDHGSNQTADLTVSGGSAALTYSFTGTGAGNLGALHLPVVEQQTYDSLYGAKYGRIPNFLVRPDNYTTWGVSGTVTAVPSSTLTLTVNSSLFTGNQQQSSLQGAIGQLEAQYIPTGFSGNLINDEYERATDNDVTTMNGLSLQWRARPWLPLTATGGVSSQQRTDITYIPFGICMGGVNDIFLQINATQGIQCSSSSDTTGLYGTGHGAVNNQSLTVSTAIPSRFVTLALGGNLNSQSTADMGVQTQTLSPGVSVPNQFLNPNGTGISPSYATFNQSTYGWFVAPTLNLSSRFFASPGFRLDGGSGGSHSSGSLGGLSAFPKIDLSYVAVDRQSKRPLWGFLTLLRPRLAFGLAGTQPAPQDRLRLFNVGSYQIPTIGGYVGGPLASQVCAPTVSLDGTTTVSAACLDALGNTQLRPERTRELEGGADVEFWQNRVSLTYTQYNKTTQDAVLPIQVATSIGGPYSIQKNVGEIRNTGTEITANAIVFESRAISWNVGANLSNNNSLVVHLNPGQQPICVPNIGINLGYGSCDGSRVVAGYPLYGIWATPIIYFSDANHDGVIEPNEIRYGDSSVFIGNPNPKYDFNLNTGVTLFSGRLGANATFAYENGLTQDNYVACSSGMFPLVPNTPGTPLATQAAVVAAGCGLTSINNVNFTGRTHIGLLQTVNTFRFNALSINYAVPRTVSSWFRVPQMMVAVQGSNLGLHTNYRGVDPNVNAFSTVGGADETLDLGQIPQPRTWWFKLTLQN